MNEQPETANAIDAQSIYSEIEKVLDHLGEVILGKPEAIRHIVVALLSKGHALIEDVPGVGKTTLARSLADILDCRFQRVSFTSDLMPSDILGVNIFNRDKNEFDFKEGPIFTNILLADELNRTTPKTQSAFLEAMEVGEVTVDTHTYTLPEPFLVMATQNPLEFSGTFPLPVSQLDRFLLRIAMGYPSPESEEQILVRYRDRSNHKPKPEKVSLEQVKSWQEAVPQVWVEPSLVSYITRLAVMTRERKEIQLGVSPRATLALQRAAQARAILDARNFVTPDDVQEMIVMVWAHRIIMSNQAGIGAQAFEQAADAIERIVTETPAPI